MKCEKCGFYLDNPQARFCPKCGGRLLPDVPAAEPVHPAESVSPAEPAQPAEPVQPTEPVRPAEPAHSPKPPRRSSPDPRTIIIAVCGAVIVVLLVVLVVVLTRKPAASDTTASAATPVPTTAPAETVEPTTAPATATPAPASESTSALEMPTVNEEPVEAPDANYPGLDVQPTHVWDTQSQTLLRVATNADNLNMRKGPGTDYDLVSQAPHDGVVTRIGKRSDNDGWILILYDGTYGWVSAEYLAPIN